jgi:hypothetical protein
MEEYVSQIHHIEGFMNPEDAKTIYDHAVKFDSSFNMHGNNEKEFKVYTYHEIEANEKSVLNLMQDYAYRVYDHVLKTYGEPFEPFNPHKTHIARFEEGHGMHDHFDSSRPNDIATLVYLNENYEGGEIYFPDYNISIKPKPGDLLCFPDQPRFVHGVKPITSGTRYTTPRWFTRIV